MKICTICQEKKRNIDFSPNKSTSDKLQSNCKKCHNIISIKWGKTKRGRMLKKETAKRWRKRNPKKVKKFYDKYKDKYRKRISANSKIYYAVKSGKLARLNCEVCKNPQVKAHHDDYNKPLQIRWLRAIHHKKWHANNNPID